MKFSFQAMWIGSIMPLSALIGGIIGGPCIEYIGRRNTILSTALPFLAGIIRIFIIIIQRMMCFIHSVHDNMHDNSRLRNKFNINYLSGWLFIALATNVAMILIGRSICGFCVGIASLSLPVYLGESIQPEVRGSLGLLPTVFGNTGKFFELCFISIIIHVKQNLISFLFFLFFGLFRNLNLLHSWNVSSLAKSCITRCLYTDTIFDPDVPNS